MATFFQRHPHFPPGHGSLDEPAQPPGFLSHELLAAASAFRDQARIKQALFRGVGDYYSLN